VGTTNIFKVGIIGAGPSGLTLALALSKRENVHVTVFEKAPDHRNIPSFNPLRSYTIDITGHGARAVKYLNMKDRFDKNLIKFKGIRIPIVQASLEETYHGDAWTGSRGDIVKAIQEEIIETTSAHNNVKIHFETEAKVFDIDNGTISFENEKRKESYDLVIGCDGAGSAVRHQLTTSNKKFEVTSLDNENYSMMLPFDQNTSELDPSYLYVFGMPPFLAVAGAINGKKGPSDPLWFCQIGYSGSRKFNSREEAKSFLLKNYPSGSKNCLSHYASDRSIEMFSKQENISTGRAKICSSFSIGKVVLIGDAASPFPPVGQGVNAAMEMAIILDKCIGDELSKSSSDNKELVISEAVKNFSLQWKPEADAIRNISFRGLNLKSFEPPFYGKIKTLWSVILHKLFTRDPMTNAKREDMTYSQALRRQKIIDLFLYSISSIVLFLILYLNLRD
jgi:2-polyprenyl-6-methoxyphenol hydroxylase-like FAD-dependent oxidoreductase